MNYRLALELSPVASLTTVLNEAFNYMNSCLYNFCNSKMGCCNATRQSFPERGRPHLVSCGQIAFSRHGAYRLNYKRCAEKKWSGHARLRPHLTSKETWDAYSSMKKFLKKFFCTGVNGNRELWLAISHSRKVKKVIIIIIINGWIYKQGYKNKV